MKTEKFISLFKFAPKSKVKAGDGLDKGNFPFYTSSSILKKRIDKAQYFEDALIFGTGGRASIHFSNEPFSTSTDCIVAINNYDVLNTKYVYYYLFGNIHLLERGFKGVGIKHISKKYIENLEIPILSIEAQNKIVSVLDKASSLIKKREQTVYLYEELLRATFLNMFGNIPTFKKTKTSVSLGDYISIKHGYAFKSKYFSEKGKYLLLTPGNFNEKGGYRERGEKQRYFSGEFSKSYLLNKGDLLIAMTEQAPGLLGSPIIISENDKFLHNQRLGLIKKKNNKLNTLFLFYLFNTGLMRNIIHVRSNGVKVKHTSPKKIEEIQVKMPTESKQEKFSVYAESIEKIIIKNKNSFNEITLLFNSILQKVFNGQLNFNVDFELDALIKEIDLQKKENDLTKISGDVAYLQRLIDKLNNQEFTERDLYDKAKHGLFQLIAVKEEDRKVIQEYQENSKSLKLALK